MRISSMLFPLLLSSALAAQTAAPKSGPMQFGSPNVDTLAQSCPVRFSVNRQPQGAVIYASGPRAWSRQQGDATLEQQQQALRLEPGFDQLTAQEQKEKLDRLAAIYRSDNELRPQGLGVTVVDGQRRIVAVDIAVHGYTAGQRIVPAAAHAEELTEMFHLTAGEAISMVDLPIWTTHIAMVNRLEITHIEYADGKAWEPSAGSRCEAAPSLFVLVGAGAR